MTAGRRFAEPALVNQAPTGLGRSGFDQALVDGCAFDLTQCAKCGEAICLCSDAEYSGTVIIDDRSEPGSWAQHIRDTECMRALRRASDTPITNGRN